MSNEAKRSAGFLASSDGCLVQRGKKKNRLLYVPPSIQGCTLPLLHSKETPAWHAAALFPPHQNCRAAAASGSGVGSTRSYSCCRRRCCFCWSPSLPAPPWLSPDRDPLPASCLLLATAPCSVEGAAAAAGAGAGAPAPQAAVLLLFKLPADGSVAACWRTSEAALSRATTAACHTVSRRNCVATHIKRVENGDKDEVWEEGEA